MTWLVRLVILALSALAWPAAAAAVAPPSTTIVGIYTYEEPHQVGPPDDFAPERGPPAGTRIADAPAVQPTVDASLHGTSASREVAATYHYTAYDVPASRAQVDSNTDPSKEPAWRIDAGLSSLQRWSVAAKTAPQVMKGPIADAVPKTLPQQLALGAAKEGHGARIMANLADDPRLVANYGPGEWVKMQYVMRGNDTNVTVHYFRNLTTKLDVEFKFK